MSDPFIGEIRAVGFNYCPRGWTPCNGQLLSISQNTALFSLLGTTYGGDGRTTFGLPDLRGRAPIHMGTGPGLSSRAWGSKGGAEKVALQTSNTPKLTCTCAGHSHEGPCEEPSTMGTLELADTDSLGFFASLRCNWLERCLKETENELGECSGEHKTEKADCSCAPTGTAEIAHENVQPYLTVNYCIALTGVFPSRN